MVLFIVSKMDSYIQLITVLIIFVFVLGLTLVVTRWVGQYQKNQSVNNNIEIIETTRISNTKYIQIIRIGGSYKVIAVSKDNITFLGDVEEKELKLNSENSNDGFKEIIEKMINKTSEHSDEPKE